jgi:hypothetical protein
MSPRQRGIAAATAAVAIVAGPAFAFQAGRAPAEGESAVKERDRPVCKTAAPAGTRFRTRTCYTAEEWDQLSENAKRDRGEMVLRRPHLRKDD